MRLLAVDCSLRTPGAALFVDHVLVRAARVRAPAAAAELPIASRCRFVASKIYEWAALLGPPCHVDELVVEWPQVLRAAKSKGDPNDLIGIAGVAAALAALCACPTKSPKPAEWVGQLPKLEVTGERVWTSPRGMRVHQRLTGEEIARVELNHDAVDAVGLGLWALGDRRWPAGRWERKRVFPGAT